MNHTGIPQYYYCTTAVLLYTATTINASPMSEGGPWIRVRSNFSALRVILAQRVLMQPFPLSIKNTMGSGGSFSPTLYEAFSVGNPCCCRVDCYQVWLLMSILCIFSCSVVPLLHFWSGDRPAQKAPSSLGYLASRWALSTRCVRT